MDASPNTPGQIGGRVVLTMTRSAARGFVQRLPTLGQDISLGVLVDLDPEADSIFVWEAEHGTSAISRPGTTGRRVAGNFLLIVNASDNDGANVVEDGFGLLLRKETWARVHEAFREGRPVEVPGAGDLMGFALNWAEESFTNPIDGQTYPARWRKYYPSPAVLDESGPASICKPASIRLLEPESAFEACVDAKVLAEYVRRVSAVVASQLGSETSSLAFDVIVQFELSPPHVARITLVERPEGNLGGGTSKLARLIEEVPVPEVRGYSVRFLVSYAMNGGTGNPLP
jgi:hypothetical protein